eukprot:7134267-Prorocentrum_lima.AAC.1
MMCPLLRRHARARVFGPLRENAPKLVAGDLIEDIVLDPEDQAGMYEELGAPEMRRPILHRCLLRLTSL